MANRAIIISLHPEWWREIRLGAKLLEIRKTRPRGNGPYTVLVYVTGGVGVVGEFVCICEYCGSRAEKEYYHTQEAQKRKQERQPRKQRTAAQTYTVKKGDCLWNIAKSVYGSGTWCYELARKNNIKNPNLIYPGQVLEI